MQRETKQAGSDEGWCFAASVVCHDNWWITGLRAGLLRAGIGRCRLVQECCGTEVLSGEWVFVLPGLALGWVQTQIRETR